MICPNCASEVGKKTVCPDCGHEVRVKTLSSKQRFSYSRAVRERFARAHKEVFMDCAEQMDELV